MLIVYNAVVLRRIKVKPFKIFSLWRLPRQMQDEPKLYPKSGPIFPSKAGGKSSAILVLMFLILATNWIDATPSDLSNCLHLSFPFLFLLIYFHFLYRLNYHYRLCILQKTLKISLQKQSSKGILCHYIIYPCYFVFAESFSINDHFLKV